MGGAPAGSSEPAATASAAASAADDLSGRMAAVSLADGRGPVEVAAAAQSAQSAQCRVAGLEAPLQALRELIGWPLRHAAEGAALGVAWPRGVLLHGPPGCGKTLLVRAAAEEFGARLHVVTAASVFGAYLGESERRLREAFAAAAADAAAGTPAVVFLDEADALCPRRGTGGGGGGQHEARVVTQLLTLLDGAAGAEAAAAAAASAAGGGRAARAAPPARVAVVAATNRPNALDPALRRPGRLDREIGVPVPGPAQRAAILRLHASGLALAADADLDAIAGACHGYSGADLAALAREAAMSALTAAADAMAAAAASGATGGAAAADSSDAGPGLVSAADFAAAMKRVGPSIVRGAQAELAPVAWDDIGGYAALKRRLQQAVEWPLRHAAAFARLGLAPPRGVLLHGPPGCSKTLLARAAAASSGATLLPLSCAQLYSMYFGEGEEALRDAFARARMAAPAIIFLDEADAVAPGRGDDADGGSGGGGAPDVSARLLSALLTEMDGLEAAPGVVVLAATNRPAALDAALLRPGRLDVLLYVGPPDADARLEALRIHTRCGADGKQGTDRGSRRGVLIYSLSPAVGRRTTPPITLLSFSSNKTHTHAHKQRHAARRRRRPRRARRDDRRLHRRRARGDLPRGGARGSQGGRRRRRRGRGPPL